MSPFSSRGRLERTFDSVVPQKRFFAHYVDDVEDIRDISGTSRFVSGGVGGITSQLSKCHFVVDEVTFSSTLRG